LFLSHFDKLSVTNSGIISYVMLSMSMIKEQIIVMLSLSKHDFMIMKNYYVYILECSDKSYYTGVTNNLEKRLAEHQAGDIHGYTSARLPVKIIYSASFSDINEAIKCEKQIKGCSRKKKEALIRGDFDSLIQLSKSKIKNISVIDQSSTGSD